MYLHVITGHAFYCLCDLAAQLTMWNLNFRESPTTSNRMLNLNVGDEPQLFTPSSDISRGVIVQIDLCDNKTHCMVCYLHEMPTISMWRAIETVKGGLTNQSRHSILLS